MMNWPTYVRFAITLSILCISPIPQALATDGRNSEVQPAQDEFSWLEVRTGEQVDAWVRRQNANTVSTLGSGLLYTEMYQKALQLTGVADKLPGASQRDSWLSNGWLYNLLVDSGHARGLFRRIKVEDLDHLNPTWEALLNIDSLAEADGKKWSFLPLLSFSPNKKRVLIALSDSGSLDLSYREFDIASHKFVPGGFHLDGSRSAFVAWLDNDNVFVASTLSGGSVTAYGNPASVRRWRRGSDLSASIRMMEVDRSDLGVSVRRYTDPFGPAEIIIESLGSNRSRYWRVLPSGGARLMTLPDQIGWATLFKGQFMFILTSDWRQGGRSWPAGSILSVPMHSTGNLSPKFTLAMGAPARGTTDYIEANASGVNIYFSHNVSGAVTRLNFYSGTWIAERLSIPENGRVLPSINDPEGTTTYVRYESFLRPPTLYGFYNASARGTVIAQLPARFVISDLEVEQRYAISADKTAIPYFLVIKKGSARDGNTPTLLRGYGAFGASQYPTYSAVTGKLWLEQGGALAVANIRGGAELGPKWHVTGAQRHHTYEDFGAVIADLFRSGVTRPRRLGIEGYSAGGLLVGVTMSTHPKWMNAVVAKVPLLDLFRMDLTMGGALNGEYGSANIGRERKLLQQTSPFQNIPGEELPAPLLITSTTDENVHPAQARRYAAKLAAMGKPFHFFENFDGGHNAAGTPADQARLDALTFTYLRQRLMDNLP